MVDESGGGFLGRCGGWARAGEGQSSDNKMAMRVLYSMASTIFVSHTVGLLERMRGVKDVAFVVGRPHCYKRASGSRGVLCLKCGRIRPSQVANCKRSIPPRRIRKSKVPIYLIPSPVITLSTIHTYIHTRTVKNDTYQLCRKYS